MIVREFMKSLFMFSFFVFVGLYVTILPLFYYKFDLVDGMNAFGYVSPPIVLQVEVGLCLVASVFCFIFAGWNVLKMVSYASACDL